MSTSSRARLRRSHVVLLSGGLDSAVCLHDAHRRGGVVLALTFDYGQRAARAEIRASAALCRRLGVRHRVVSLPWLSEITASSLVRRGRAVPRPQPDALDRRRAADVRARAVWVPNRNGVFLAIAASHAEALGAGYVAAGFNAEEAHSFPDNSAPFVRATERALAYSTLSRVRLRSPTLRLRKTGILRAAQRLCVPLGLVFPCYEAGPRLCGRCESCLRFARARASATR